MLVYCDSCIPIYYFDHIGSWKNRTATYLATIASRGDQVAISDLVRLECRVKPIATGDTAKLLLFDQFFARPDVRMIAISSSIFERATDIRAKYRFRLGDSLHLAAAAEASCGRFLTNDNRLSVFADIQVVTLP